MLIVFDLELTAWPGSADRNWSAPGEYPEIIQIGAVRLDKTLAETGALDLVVKPTLNPELSDYIIALTGLAQERIDRDGIGLARALSEFVAFARGAELVLCNGGDPVWIARNAALVQIDNPVATMRFASLSAHFRQAAGRTAHVVSSTLPEVFGFSLSGHTHDGLADARAIAEALRRTLPPGGVPALVRALDTSR